MHDCDAVLVRDIRISSLRRSQQIAWLSLVDEHTYNAQRQSLQANLAFLGLEAGGSFADFDRERRDYLEKQDFRFEQAEAFGLFTSKVPPEAFNAWVECHRINNPAPAQLFIKDASPDAVVVEFRFRPAAGPAHDYPLDVKVRGGAPPADAPKTLNGDQRFTWICTRDKDTDFRMVVNVGEGYATAHLLIPHYTAPAPDSVAWSQTLMRAAPECREICTYYQNYRGPSNWRDDVGGVLVGESGENTIVEHFLIWTFDLPTPMRTFLLNFGGATITFSKASGSGGGLGLLVYEGEPNPATLREWGKFGDPYQHVGGRADGEGWYKLDGETSVPAPPKQYRVRFSRPLSRLSVALVMADAWRDHTVNIRVNGLAIKHDKEL